MGKLKLTVNEEKTRICTVPSGKFDFLGYTFGRMYSARTGQARLGYWFTGVELEPARPAAEMVDACASIEIGRRSSIRAAK